MTASWAPHLWVKPLLPDAVGAVVLFLVVSATTSGPAATPAGQMVWALGYALPLVWRRTAPDAAAVALVGMHLLQLALAPALNPGNITVPLILYAVAAYGREEWSKRWLWVGLAASVVAGFAWGPLRTAPPWHDAASNGLFLLLLWSGACGSTVAAAWYMGSLRRARKARVQAVADREAALLREQVQSVTLAATQERQRLAREMHDIVAHSLSIIVVQADGAHYVATDAPGSAEERLARAAQAIETIQSTARSALAETRRLVGVLHSNAEDAELAPTASLADIDALVRGVADTGRAATLSVTGNPLSHPPLGAIGELTAYRVVQESLTNVLKHAGPTASVRVMLVHRPEGISVSIADDGRGADAGHRPLDGRNPVTGPGPAARDGRGHGLIGMRERVGALGGTLSTGSSPRGGFEVHAFIPAQRENP